MHGLKSRINICGTIIHPMATREQPQKPPTSKGITLARVFASHFVYPEILGVVVEGAGVPPSAFYQDGKYSLSRPELGLIFPVVNETSLSEFRERLVPLGAEPQGGRQVGKISIYAVVKFTFC